MEGQDDVKPNAPRIGKRPPATRTGTGIDSKPRKHKPSPKLSPSAVNSFQMESRVHDVEEHFRRSFQQMNNRPHPLQPVKVSSSDTMETSSITMATTPSDSHQIIISENVSPRQHGTTPTPEETTPVPSPSASTPGSTHQQLEGSPSQSCNRVASSPNLVSPQQQGAPPPLLFSMPGGSLTTSDTLKTVKSYNEVLSLAATQQLITAATLGQSVASNGGRGGVIFPNILPIATSQSNFIPVVDGNGVTQLMASPAAHPSSTNNTISQTPQTAPPLLFLGPGGIPLLPAAAASTQPSMYLVNMSADLASLQQQQQQNQQQPQRSPATITTPPSLSTPTQPSYIVLPPSFQIPQSLTLEQLQSLSASFQQRQEQQVAESRQVEVPGKQSGSGNGDNTSIRSPISHHNGGDEVEEHFARALGEKWHQYKKDSNPLNKIST